MKVYEMRIERSWLEDAPAVQAFNGGAVDQDPAKVVHIWMSWLKVQWCINAVQQFQGADSSDEWDSKWPSPAGCGIPVFRSRVDFSAGSSRTRMAVRIMLDCATAVEAKAMVGHFLPFTKMPSGGVLSVREVSTMEEMAE